MIIEAEFRGIRTEEASFKNEKNNNQVETRNRYTLHIEQDDPDSVEAEKLTVREEDIQAFSGLTKGDRIKLSLTTEAVSNSTAKIYGTLIRRVRLLGRPAVASTNGTARRSAPPVPVS